jgi:hypothetical protein
MSRIGQANIEMTERVNELGYETVEEAIADGWDSAEFYASYEKQNMVPAPYKPKDEQTKAHEAWLDEKKVIIGDLTNMLIGLHAQGKSNGTDYAVIKRTLDFITRGEM